MCEMHERELQHVVAIVLIRFFFHTGMHQRQMYVQQSQHMREKVEESLKHAGQDIANRALPRVMWRPYLNTGSCQTTGIHDSPVV